MSDLEDHNQLFDLIGKMLEYDPAGLTLNLYFSDFTCKSLQAKSRKTI